jgi:peroxin-2
LPGKRAERRNPGSEEKTSYTRKSVMFDLDDEKEEQMRVDEDPLEAMEPMPMDESQAWSEVNEGNNPGEEESEDGD